MKSYQNQSFIEKHNSKFEYLEFVIMIFYSLRFLIAWVFIDKVNIEDVYELSVLIYFEFLMVHSGIFMAFFPKKISLLFFVPFYGVFALIYNHMVGGNTIAYVYLICIFNRMRFAFFNVNENLKIHVRLKSVLALIVYLPLFFFSLFAGDLLLPDFSLSYENLVQKGYYKMADFILIEQPKKGMFLGFSYYLILAFLFFPRFFSKKDEIKEVDLYAKMNSRRKRRRIKKN